MMNITMTTLNEHSSISTGKRKRGEVREDGKIFLRYSKGKECWVTPLAFEVQTLKIQTYNKKYESKKPVEKIEAERARYYGRRMLWAKKQTKNTAGRAKEVLSLHNRGKDIVTISLRMGIPISTITEIINNK